MSNFTRSASPETQVPSGRMSLEAVRSGRLEGHPRRVLLYGPEKIGKSTFAAQAEAPIFLCPEDGTAELDVARLPEPQNWADVMEVPRMLQEEPHPYRTLVIDTADWIEPLCWSYVCKRDGRRSIEDYPYKTGYIVSLEEWRSFVTALDELRAARKMDIIILAHATIRTFKNPEGDDYDRFGLKVHERVGGLLKEWVDAVLFANYEAFPGKGSARDKATGGKARVLHTQRSAAWDAGNRWDLPETLPLSWTDFSSALEWRTAGRRAHRLRAEVMKAAARFGDTELLDKVRLELEKTPIDNITRLSVMLNRLTAKLSLRKAEPSERLVDAAISSSVEQRGAA